MTDYEKLQQAVEILRKFNLPISPILEYSINEKLQELSYQVETQSVIQEVSVAPISYAEPVQSDEYPPIKAPARLRVTRPDGSVIQDHKAANTFCQVIKEIGPEIIQELGISVDYGNLILRDQGSQRLGDKHDIGNNYYVNTHSSTAAKKRQLEKIFSALHLPWKVEII